MIPSFQPVCRHWLACMVILGLGVLSVCDGTLRWGPPSLKGGHFGLGVFGIPIALMTLICPEAGRPLARGVVIYWLICFGFTTLHLFPLPSLQVLSDTDSTFPLMLSDSTKRLLAFPCLAFLLMIQRSLRPQKLECSNAVKPQASKS
jgi:hypothetical protein